MNTEQSTKLDETQNTVNFSLINIINFSLVKIKTYITFMLFR